MREFTSDSFFAHEIMSRVHQLEEEAGRVVGALKIEKV